MKTNSLTVLVAKNRKRVQVSNPFTWTTVQKFYNAIPGEVTPCKTVYDAKMYTCAGCLIMAAFFYVLLLPGVYLFFSAKKGGKR